MSDTTTVYHQPHPCTARTVKKGDEAIGTILAGVEVAAGHIIVTDRNSNAIAVCTKDEFAQRFSSDTVQSLAARIDALEKKAKAASKPKAKAATKKS